MLALLGWRQFPWDAREYLPREYCAAKDLAICGAKRTVLSLSAQHASIFCVRTGKHARPKQIRGIFMERERIVKR